MGKKNMSLIHLKRLIASITLVLVLTTQTFAVQGFRPWAPYQRDQFGGGPQQREGVYGVVEGVFYVFAPTKNIIVGATDVNGNSAVRSVWSEKNQAIITQTNTIDTTSLGSMHALGTRGEFGFNRGHHGWYIAGYSLPNAERSATMHGASLVIEDGGTSCTAFSIITGEDDDTTGRYNMYWNGDSSLGWSVKPQDNEPIPNVPFLYGWFTDGDGNGRLAPLPITFDRARVTTKMEHWTIEAMYTYRFHPTRFGQFDVLGGVRYAEFDDSLNFYGEGLPWTGVRLSSTTYTVPNTNTPNDASGSPSSSPTQEITKISISGTPDGVGSVLGNSKWEFMAENHIVAPQFGVRLARTNNRWTLTGEGIFLAGLNTQNYYSKGTLGSYYTVWEESQAGGSSDDNNSNNNNNNTGTDGGRNLPQTWTPIGLMDSGRSFYHRKTHTEFSPGVEVKIAANWQLTNAVGIQFGVNAMWMDNIAKGAYVNDYTIHPSGQIFGINDYKRINDDLLMYGARIGVTINRF